MALENIPEIKILMTMATLFAISISMTAATVHIVRDSDGWTLPRHYDYEKWSASRHFFIGDELVFNYDPQEHNVLEVNEQDFMSCNRTSPISCYTSSNGSIILNSFGDFFFICGTPGHCEADQRLRVDVYKGQH